LSIRSQGFEVSFVGNDLITIINWVRNPSLMNLGRRKLYLDLTIVSCVALRKYALPSLKTLTLLLVRSSSIPETLRRTTTLMKYCGQVSSPDTVGLTLAIYPLPGWTSPSLARSSTRIAVGTSVWECGLIAACQLVFGMGTRQCENGVCLQQQKIRLRTWASCWRWTTHQLRTC